MTVGVVVISFDDGSVIGINVPQINNNQRIPHVLFNIKMETSPNTSFPIIGSGYILIVSSDDNTISEYNVADVTRPYLARKYPLYDFTIPENVQYSYSPTTNNFYLIAEGSVEKGESATKDNLSLLVY